VISSWHDNHPDQDVPDGLTLTQPWPAGPSDQRRDETIYYRYSADRARRTLRGIDTQVAKAEKAVAGKIPVKRNRFVHLSGATRSINRDLEKRARTLAGWKDYVTNLPNPDPETVISAYHRLYNIEKSFRMSKSDLRARPIYHHLRQSIEVHPTSPKPSTTSTTTLNEPSRARRALRVAAPVAPTDRTVLRRKERHGGPPGQEDAQGLD